MSFLPSKNFIIFVIGTAVIGTGIFFVASFLKESATFSQDNTETTGFLKDTVGGTRELLQNFPQEETSSEETGDNTRGAYAYNEENLTESVSRELLASLILRGDPEISGESVSDALNELFKTVTQFETPTVYTEKNARVTENAPEYFKTYGNAVIDVIARYKDANAENVLRPFELLLDNKDEGAARALYESAEEYGRLASSVLDIPVPGKIVPLHIHFVNTIHAIGNATANMGSAEKDPFRGLVGFSIYIKELEQAREILSAINQIFMSEKITFTKNESGRAWRNFEQ